MTHEFKIGDLVRTPSGVGIITKINYHDVRYYDVNLGFETSFHGKAEDLSLLPINKQFIEGHSYQLRPDYPLAQREIVFEGRLEFWNNKSKYEGWKDGQIHKVIRFLKEEKTFYVEFEGVMGGNWTYYSEDFIDVTENN